MPVHWSLRLMHAMSLRGYCAADMRDAVRYAERWGTLWGCPVVTWEHRRELAGYLPATEAEPFEAAHAVSDVVTIGEVS